MRHTNKEDTKMTSLQETIKQALKIKELNNMPFVTIWKTGKSLGFNFENKPVGYEVSEFGVKRVCVGVY